MTGSRLAHNKFLVVCEPAKSPQLAWTGSTNWTMTGLCTQVNNGLRIENAAIAKYYKAEWDALLESGDEFPPKLVDGNGTKRSADAATAASAPGSSRCTKKSTWSRREG